MVGTDRHEEAQMQSRQLKHTTLAASSDPEGGEGAWTQGRHAGADDIGLTHIDWMMIVSIVVLGVLMGYLAYNGWLPGAFW